jgi:hypothetical protein
VSPRRLAAVAAGLLALSGCSKPQATCQADPFRPLPEPGMRYQPASRAPHDAIPPALRALDARAVLYDGDRLGTVLSVAGDDPLETLARHVHGRRTSFGDTPAVVGQVGGTYVAGGAAGCRFLVILTGSDDVRDELASALI